MKKTVEQLEEEQAMCLPDDEYGRIMKAIAPQLVIILVKKLGGVVEIPLKEMDDTGQDLLAFRIDENKTFHFEVKKKS